MKLSEAIIKKWFCSHKWEAVTDVKNRYTGSVCAIVYTCKECGKFKKISV
jgi:hypothetical protein